MIQNNSQTNTPSNGRIESVFIPEGKTLRLSSFHTCRTVDSVIEWTLFFVHPVCRLFSPHDINNTGQKRYTNAHLIESDDSINMEELQENMTNTLEEIDTKQNALRDIQDKIIEIEKSIAKYKIFESDSQDRFRKTDAIVISQLVRKGGSYCNPALDRENAYRTIQSLEAELKNLRADMQTIKEELELLQNESNQYCRQLTSQKISRVRVPFEKKVN